MVTQNEATQALAKAISLMVEACRDSYKSMPAELLSRLVDADERMDKAIAKVDTLEELFSELGDSLFSLVFEAGRQYVKKVGPAGLIEAALKSPQAVADFIDGVK